MFPCCDFVYHMVFVVCNLMLLSLQFSLYDNDLEQFIMIMIYASVILELKTAHYTDFYNGAFLGY